MQVSEVVNLALSSFEENHKEGIQIVEALILKVAGNGGFRASAEFNDPFVRNSFRIYFMDQGFNAYENNSMLVIEWGY